MKCAVCGYMYKELVEETIDFEAGGVNYRVVGENDGVPIVMQVEKDDLGYISDGNEDFIKIKGRV